MANPHPHPHQVLEAGLSPLKINCVLMRDTPGLPGNEHELLDFARLSVRTLT